MALEFDAGVALGLGTSALIAIGAPLALALVLWRRGASFKAWGIGALTFVVSQFLLRFPWQVPLNAWLVARYRDDAVVMGAWIAASALTAGLFEELGRWVAYRKLWKDRSTLGGVMLGAGHGGLESMVLVGLSLVSSTVVYVLVAKGVPIGLPPEAMAAVEKQFATLDGWSATMGGLERLSALGLHLACSLLVLEGVRTSKRGWLVGSIALHAGANLAVVSASKALNVFAGEALLVVIVAVALTLSLRRSRASEGGVQSH